MIQKTLRLWRTVKYLKPVQIYGRFWFLLYKPSIRAVEGRVSTLRNKDWIKDVPKPGVSLEGSCFTFLGECGALEEVHWDGPQREKLWRYNQHYFDYLNSAVTPRQKKDALFMLNRWLDQVTPGQGNAWEPYPTSLRIVNWIKWALGGNTCPEGFDNSLLSQADWLSKKLEYHLLGNHLFANAKALVFAGLYYDGKEASKWLQLGLGIIERELNEQILEDGGHFELSPMYHAISYADLLDLCNLANCYDSSDGKLPNQLARNWNERLSRMRDWLKLMTHKDGGVSFFNDSALGIAPDAVSLYDYHERLLVATGVDGSQYSTSSVAVPDNSDLSYKYLNSSGYIVVSAGSMSSILDVAPIGPDYLPGHAHADSLSFEMSIAAQRVFVNSGTSCYGSSAERLRQRGTAAHNTVVVDGRDSSEVWGGFRVGQRAYVKNIKVLPPNTQNADSGLIISAEHDGYKKLKGGLIHSRSWKFCSKRFVVSDSLSESGFDAYSKYLLHPDIEVVQHTDARIFTLRCGADLLLEVHVEVGEPVIEQSSWHPEFGVSLPTNCLVVRLKDGVSSRVVVNH